MKNRNCILTRIVSSLLAVILTGTAVFCTSSRISGHGIYELLPVIAAGSAFHIVPGSVHSTSPASSIQDNHTTEIPSNIKNEEKTDKRKTDDKSPAVKRKNNEVKSADREFKSSEPTESEIRKYDLEHKDEEKYPVVEFTTTQGNISYDGIQVKNNSSYDLDIKEELGGKLGFTIERSEQPQVLIHHYRERIAKALHGNAFYICSPAGSRFGASHYLKGPYGFPYDGSRHSVLVGKLPFGTVLFKQ